MTLNKRDKLKMCSGCHSNFYNGNNPYGITECWSLKRAKVVQRKEVHINQVPPWKQEAIRVLDCFKRDHYIYVGPKDEY